MISCVSVFGSDYFGQVICSLYAFQSEIVNENPEDPTPNRRKPSAPIVCSISLGNGVEFLNGITPEILYYEMDAEGMAYKFTDESEFVQALFSDSGEVKIVITTPQCDYVGYISL